MANGLVVADPFRVMDTWDDEVIVREIHGEITKDWVYEMTDRDGRLIRALSKVGVDQAVRHLIGRHEIIREAPDPKIERTEDACYVVVQAQRWLVTPEKELLLDTALGAKRQPYTMRKRDGTTVPNEFWFEQAVIKAARNARLRLLSPEVINEIMQQAASQGRVRAGQTISSKPQRFSPTQRNSTVSPAEPQPVPLDAFVMEELTTEDGLPSDVEYLTQAQETDYIAAMEGATTNQELERIAEELNGRLSPEGRTHLASNYRQAKSRIVRRERGLTT